MACPHCGLDEGAPGAGTCTGCGRPLLPSDAANPPPDPIADAPLTPPPPALATLRRLFRLSAALGQPRDPE